MEKLLNSAFNKCIFVSLIMLFTFSIFVFIIQLNNENIGIFMLFLGILSALISVGGCVFLLRKIKKGFVLLSIGFIGILASLSTVGLTLANGLFAYRNKANLAKANGYKMHPIGQEEIAAFLLIELPIILLAILVIQLINNNRKSTQGKMLK